MKKLIVTGVWIMILTVMISSANAFFPRDRINENFSYDNLKFIIEDGKCYLQGTIINQTDKRRDDISITFYALTINDKTLWKKRIRINLIDKYGKFNFKEQIKKCKKEEPYKWEITVKE